jgi:hypothetical protein
MEWFKYPVAHHMCYPLLLPLAFTCLPYLPVCSHLPALIRICLRSLTLVYSCSLLSALIRTHLHSRRPIILRLPYFAH